MAGHDIIVIGASAGGLQALKTLFSLLPGKLPSAFFVVLHRPYGEDFIDRLEATLSVNPGLPATRAVDGERFQHGHIYLAPATSHLLIERGVTRTDEGPKEVHSRPSVDVLFRSAALAYGRRVVGVVLSGMLNDGTAGLWQIKKRGGIAIVQDPDEAAYPAMPSNAKSAVPVDYCLPLAGIASTLVTLTSEQLGPVPASASKARVLIVEDERIVAMHLENRLRKLGYEVTGSIAAAEEAIETVRRTMPDVVLMDIQLSGEMRGTEAARMIWEQFQIPVVYLTACADDKTLDEAKQSMPYGYVVKPFGQEQIYAAIQVALDRYAREMQLG